MQELSDVFVKFVNNITGPAWALLWVLGMLVATFWVVSIFSRTVRGAKMAGVQPVTGMEVIAVILIASLLAHYSGWITNVSQTLGLESASFGLISYVDPGGSLGKFADVINASMTFASLMGGVYGFKGLMLFHKHCSGGGQGRDLLGQAFVHILFGGILVRISQFISNLSNTVS